MHIRRSFKFCSSHVVRNCTSTRCSQSIHGHNYVVEIFLTSQSWDNAQMILDFGILKNEIAEFIDCFDHSFHFWDQEEKEFINFIRKYSQRWVSLSHNPSAESYALLFLFFANKILEATSLGNGEMGVYVSSVRVHETDHGFAEAFYEDLLHPIFSKNVSLYSIDFSQSAKDECKNKDILGKVIEFNILLEGLGFRDATKRVLEPQNMNFEDYKKFCGIKKPFIYALPTQQIPSMLGIYTE